MLNFPTIPHFEMREAQRGYRREQIAYVLEFGTVYRRAGAIFFVLLRRDIPDGDRRRDDVWRLAGTVVVVEGGVVKTVYRNADPVRHVERKAKYCAKRGKATAHEFGQGEESDAGRGFIAA